MCLQEQHDLLCVLLMIRLNAEHRTLMVARRVPCLDDYLDRVNLLLWPRFKVCGGRGGQQWVGQEVGFFMRLGWGGGGEGPAHGTPATNPTRDDSQPPGTGLQ